MHKLKQTNLQIDDFLCCENTQGNEALNVNPEEDPLGVVTDS